MELYEVLEKRRTYRDFTDCAVSDEILKRVIGAAFKAPTNDHLRQLEFIVVRGRENIAQVIAPLVKNMAAFKELVFEVDDTGDEEKMENAYGERIAHFTVLPSKTKPVAETCGAKLAQLFCIRMVCIGEHAACCHQ